MIALAVMLALVVIALLPGLVMVARSPEGFFSWLEDDEA